MASLVLKNLCYDKVRFIVTLTGIVFSVVLATIQLRRFVGFSTTTACIIEHSHADLWITSKKVAYLEAGVPFSERKLYQVFATPGVARAKKHIVQFGNWKLPNGAVQGVLLIGF